MKKAVGEIDVATIVQLREGDEAAFRLVFECYNRRLYLFAYKFLKNREQSEEVVQETFLNLWNSRKTVREEYPISCLLFTIAKRLTLNLLRKASKQLTIREELWRSISETHNETEETILGLDLKKFAEKVVLTLPKQQQTVFRLSRYDNLSYDEIAEKLNISRNTVKNHLVQALKNLRYHFSDSDYLVSLLIFLFF